MFTCEIFMRLDEEMQAQLLFAEGIFLMTRTTEKFRVELFLLYNFYVEVFFENEDEPLFIKPFQDVADLRPYLGLINIDALLENTDNR